MRKTLTVIAISAAALVGGTSVAAAQSTNSVDSSTSSDSAVFGSLDTLSSEGSVQSDGFSLLAPNTVGAAQALAAQLISRAEDAVETANVSGDSAAISAAATALTKAKALADKIGAATHDSQATDLAAEITATVNAVRYAERLAGKASSERLFNSVDIVTPTAIYSWIKGVLGGPLTTLQELLAQIDNPGALNRVVTDAIKLLRQAGQSVEGIGYSIEDAVRAALGLSK